MGEFNDSAHGFGFAVEFPTDDIGGTVGRAVSMPDRTLGKTAVGSGIAAAFLCAALLAPQISAVLAEGGDGSSTFFMHEMQAKKAVVRPAFVPVAAPASLGKPVAARANLGRAIYSFTPPAANRIYAAKPRAPRSVIHARLIPASVESSGSAAVGNGRQSVCVRLCDGYFFPVGDLNGASEVPAQEAVCDNLCPGAPTRLYVLPSGSDNIEDAVSVRDSQSYSALPVAFNHTSRTERTCACHAELRPPSQKLLQDFTLRKGDGVMTPKGIKVFHGAQHWPYRRNDFLSLAETQDLSGADRGALAAIEQAAKGIRPVIPVGKPIIAPTKINATPVRTRRDANGKDIRIVGPQANLE